MGSLSAHIETIRNTGMASMLEGCLLSQAWVVCIYNYLIELTDVLYISPSV